MWKIPYVRCTAAHKRRTAAIQPRANTGLFQASGAMKMSLE
jgi:hypothetical protein